MRRVAVAAVLAVLGCEQRATVIGSRPAEAGGFEPWPVAAARSGELLPSAAPPGAPVDGPDRDRPDLAQVDEPPAEPPAAPDDAADPFFATYAQVFSTDRPYPGMLVHLVGVPVRSRSGHGVWVGYERELQVFVVPIDPSQVSFLTPGARIDVRGELVAAPAAAFSRQHLALSRKAARRLAAEPHYVEAWSITEP